MFSIPTHGCKTVLYASTIHVCIKLYFIQCKVSICGNYSTFPFLLAVGGGHVGALSPAAFPDHGATQQVACLCQCCIIQLYPVNSHLPSPWCCPRFHIPLCLPDFDLENEKLQKTAHVLLPPSWGKDASSLPSQEI